MKYKVLYAFLHAGEFVKEGEIIEFDEQTDRMYINRLEQIRAIEPAKTTASRAKKAQQKDTEIEGEDTKQGEENNSDETKDNSVDEATKTDTEIESEEDKSDKPTKLAKGKNDKSEDDQK